MIAKGWIVIGTLAVGLASAAPRLAAADTYAWTDENGVKHVTDRLSAVPEAARASAVHVGGTSVSSPRATPEAHPATGSDGGRSPTPPATAAPGSDEVFRMGADPVVKAAPVASPAPGEGDESAPGEKDQNGHDERWWQDQMARALNRQSKYSDQVRTLEANKIILTYGGPAERSKHRQDLTEARKNLDAATHSVDDLKKQAKSAGANPKWLVLPGLEEEGKAAKP